MSAPFDTLLAERDLLARCLALHNSLPVKRMRAVGLLLLRLR